MSIDRGVDKEDVVHKYNGILLSHWIEWNNAIFSNMDGPGDYYTKWNKSNREKQISWYHLYVECKKKKKKIQMNLFTKQKQTHRLREWSYGYGGKGGGAEGLGVWDWHVHTAIFKIDNQQGPTV